MVVWAMRMHKFGRVAVLMGGISPEREISLVSGQAVLKSLKNQGVDAIGIDVRPDNINELVNANIDRAFIALHGNGGEDGAIQGVLEWLGVPYTGSGICASAIAMDKIKTKLIWQAYKIPTPKFLVYQPGMNAAEIARALRWPIAVKPATQGSSVGVHKVEKVADLQAALEDASQYGEVLLEEWVSGAEYSIGIVGQQVLPVIKIVPKKDTFYDYSAKYITHDTAYQIPSGLSDDIEKVLSAYAWQAFEVLGCRHWGRVDCMVAENGEIYFLEMNTIPGMTPTSLVPKEAACLGVSFDQLVLNILAETL